MPVATRSQISGLCDEMTTQSSRLLRPPPGLEPRGTTVLRNPHHGLKEKMKALTLLYEQHKQLAATRDPLIRSEIRSSLTHQPNFDLLDSDCKKRASDGEGETKKKEAPELVMRENIMPPSRRPMAAKNHILQPRIDAKENLETDSTDRIVSFSCPKKTKITTMTTRKLSMGGAGVHLGEGALRRIDAKENLEMDSIDRIVSFSCPKKAKITTMTTRKLSMGGAGVHLEGGALRSKKAGTEQGLVYENSEGGSRILVFVRLRPMSKKEKEAGSRCSVKIVNRKEVYLTEFASETDYLRLKRLRGRHFCFDAAFPDSTTQLEVYRTTTSELVEGVLQGRNGSIFCYGATGAGKTYTMLGTVENPGVMVLAIKDLFAKIRQRSYGGNHVVHLSYLEVYNETVRDLLSPGRPLILREDKQGIVAAGLTQYRAYSTAEVMALLQQGNLNRTTEPTRVNETSSRSHAILQVVAEYRVKDSVNVVTRVGKLSLIDLAGSERALATDQRTQRSLEGANINRSLLALSSCINALVEGKKHIPYRNSKLTQLLKDSLGGPCNTVMIANISPSNLSFGETQNTLHWADRAKEIKTKACNIHEEAMQVPESETDQAKLVLQLQKENSELRQQLIRHQQKLFTIQAQALTANSSPVPSSIASPLQSTPYSTQKKPKRSILAGNCFSTPESRKKGANDIVVQDLQIAVKNLEAEINRLKKEHIVEMRQKDDTIRELLVKNESKASRDGKKMILTRASLRKGERSAAEGELKSSSHRFLSPAPTVKKRSFWDITGANSPSVTTGNIRKARIHAADVTTPSAPSMLLQPGFARQRQ